MIPWLLAGLGAAFLLLTLLNWWAHAETSTAKSAILAAIIGLCLLLSVALIAAGKGILAIIPSGYAIVRLLAPYAGRYFLGKAASRAGGAQTRQKPNVLSRSEALDILGLEEGASSDDIQNAYKKLMNQVHPDKGGSDWMASKLNEARRVLLDDN